MRESDNKSILSISEFIVGGGGIGTEIKLADGTIVFIAYGQIGVYKDEYDILDGEALYLEEIIPLAQEQEQEKEDQLAEVAHRLAEFKIFPYVSLIDRLIYEHFTIRAVPGGGFFLYYTPEDMGHPPGDYDAPLSGTAIDDADDAVTTALSLTREAIWDPNRLAFI